MKNHHERNVYIFNFIMGVVGCFVAFISMIVMLFMSNGDIFYVELTIQGIIVAILMNLFYLGFVVYKNVKFLKEFNKVDRIYVLFISSVLFFLTPIILYFVIT